MSTFKRFRPDVSAQTQPKTSVQPNNAEPVVVGCSAFLRHQLSGWGGTFRLVVVLLAIAVMSLAIGLGISFAASAVSHHSSGMVPCLTGGAAGTVGTTAVSLLQRRSAKAKNDVAG